MAVERTEQNRDLTLAPNTFLYLQNVGKGGLITVHRGPTAVTQTGQDEPVRYDETTQTFKRCRLEEAVVQFKRANEGDYVILENPCDDGGFPTGNAQASKELKQGRRIVIPGPWSEALWPSQSATVVEGHKLRTNQYLIATIYNADEAEKNWDKTVVKPVTAPEETKVAAKKGLPRPESFAVGSRIIIRGTDVSFYIPCTGVQVLQDENKSFVREAVTLEQLEYSILIDENGKKEYPRGPAVVFPKPTQIFATDSEKRRKFKPLELNSINGIHLKVTADFTGPDIEASLSETRDFKEGEELFVTGKTLSIYYPREELAIIAYGEGNNKHYSTAIPVGEGRYVINRESGEIRLLKGPKMFLADPRTEIPVRRVLSEDECALWYPGNQTVLEYNRELAMAMATSPSGRSGTVSEGDYRKLQAHKLAATGMGTEAAYLASSGSFAQQEALQNFRREDTSTNVNPSNIVRQTAFTPPRTLTLNTKFDGVPRIEVWPGYAVLVVGADGSRKVCEGPQVVLMEYHEKLGFMTLSTGKPKTTDKLMKTAYLCTLNNQVSDVVPFESADHVKGKVKISLRVNFESKTPEDKLKWFGVDNYVKLLTDHVRSMVAGLAKKKRIGEFKADYINLTRDAIMGAKVEGKERPGLFFEMINLRVYEVEVLELTLDDANISKLLDQAQQESVQANIELERLHRKLETTKEKERIAQEEAFAAATTQRKKNEFQEEVIATQISLTLAQVEAELKRLEGEKQKKIEQESLEDISHKAELQRSKETADQAADQNKIGWLLEKDKLDATTNAAVERFQAAKDGLHEVLVMMGREDMAARLAEAMNIERFLTGDSAINSISNILAISPMLKGFFDQSTAAGAKYQQKRMERMFPASPSIPAAAGADGKK